MPDTTPPTYMPTMNRKHRPSEINKYVTSIIFGALLSTAGFVLFAYTPFSPLRTTGFLLLLSFVFAFLFNSIFQLTQKCPYNPVTVSVASLITTIVVLFTSLILYIPLIGPFLIGIVESAFPYTELPSPIPLDKSDPKVIEAESITKNKHVYSYAYAYWMFWSGLLPMYTLLSLIGTC